MSVSEAGICNFALAHLGHDKQITSLDDRNTEARNCNLWYVQCRDEALRDYAWPFAVTTADLALVEDFTGVQNAEWGYSYAMPDDALKVVRLPYGSSRNPAVAGTVKFRIKRRTGGGKLLFTDQDTATIEYIVRVEDPSEFAPDFIVALSHLIAARIAPAIVSEGRVEKQSAQLNLYAATLAKAKANAANEETPDEPPDSPYLGARA